MDLSSPRIGRLQRPPDFTGPRLNLFRQIFLRHGLPAALLGFGLLLFLPGAWQLAEASVSNLRAAPMHYLGLGVLLATGLVLYSHVRFRNLSLIQLGWIVYLGCLSLWEEWLFRVVGPFFLTELGVAKVAAILMSNVLFGAMHYFTLRWRLDWCLFAFLGGLGFSYSYASHGDLMWVAGIHWIATFLNTPRPPAGELPQTREE